MNVSSIIMSLTRSYVNTPIKDSSIIFVNQSNGDAAIKIFPLPESHEAFETESKVYQILKHHSQHICKVNQSIQEEDYAFLIMKKYDCDLYSFAFEGAPLQLCRVRKLFKNICACVLTIHKHNIAHLDIKPENILVDIATEKVVLCDFGYAFVKPMRPKRMQRQDCVIRRGCGTRKYSAPEKSNNTFDPFAADIYSLGVLLFVLLTGFFPHKNSDSDEIDLEETIQKLSCIPEECKYLLRRMLATDPANRMTAKEVVQHEWVADRCKTPKLLFWR